MKFYFFLKKLILLFVCEFVPFYFFNFMKSYRITHKSFCLISSSKQRRIHVTKNNHISLISHTLNELGTSHDIRLEMMLTSYDPLGFRNTMLHIYTQHCLMLVNRN